MLVKLNGYKFGKGRKFIEIIVLNNLLRKWIYWENLGGGIVI